MNIRMHASTVVFERKGVLITGPAGSGKSGLALELMSRGAKLVSDDCTEITLRDGLPWAMPHNKLEGMIEARGIGILAADNVPGTYINLVIDLSKTTDERTPKNLTTAICGRDIPTLHKVESRYFAAAITQYLKGGKVDI